MLRMRNDRPDTRFNTMKSFKILPALLLPALAGCGGTTVRYEDPAKVETINSDFGSTDLLMIAQKMTQSFTNSNVWGEGKPRIVFGGVKNRTRQHLDTQNITDTIRTALIQSGKFTVLAGQEGIEELNRESTYQQSGAVDQAAAVELGKQLGGEYVLFGRFTEIRKRNDDIKSSWLKFTMNAVNVQTREIVWADEQQISKIEEKASVGW